MGWEQMAEQMGVRVVRAVPPHGWWGCWDPDKRTVTLHPGLAHIQLRSTAWHELGHVHYGHAGRSRKQEHQANVWAARHLIKPARFIHAARITDDLLTIAEHLNVMPDDVKTWQQTLTLEELIHIRKEINGPS